MRTIFFFLALLSLLASRASASTWTITTYTGETIALEVTRSPTGYRAALHEQRHPWRRMWEAVPCPGAGQLQAGERLMDLERQRDGTFIVKIFKARMYVVGPGGMGTGPVTQCVFEPLSYTGRIVDRFAANRIDPAQVGRYPRDHDSFLVLEPTYPPCPVPEDRKYTCGGIWPFRPIIDMPMVDTDADGLFDEWELGGIREGSQFLDLKAMGADPDHKDLFIQMDASSETAYPQRVLNEAANVLKRIPISNPDGRSGINLHVDAGPSSLMNPLTSATWGSLSRAETTRTGSAHFSAFSGGEVCPDRAPFEYPMIELYNQRLEPLRRKAFRYVIVVKHLGPGNNCHSGEAWSIPSKYFAIASYHKRNRFSENELLGTFLHELGHAIGLYHGGADDEPNYNPVYQSVMNYTYQFPGIWRRGQSRPPGEYHYSYVPRSSSNALDERRLSERTGFPDVGLPGMEMAYKCRLGLFSAIPGDSTDFDCDHRAATRPPIDLTPTNDEGPTTLFSHDDVSNMRLSLDFGSSGRSRGYRGETRTIGEARQEVATLINDTQAPTMRLTVRNERGRRFVVIEASDDVGLASASVTSGGRTQAISLSSVGEVNRNSTQRVEVSATGVVTVTVSDTVGNDVTATAR